MEKREGYAPGWSGDALDMMGRRTVADRASFALPFLSEVDRLLDVGCGPGTITIGLAQAAPAVAVLGVDREGSQVAMAQEAAQAAGVTNARFEQGSAYALPLEDRSVDLVFAHAVFEHLALPRRAFAEFGRVLRAGSRYSHALIDKIIPCGGVSYPEAGSGQAMLPPEPSPARPLPPCTARCGCRSHSRLPGKPSWIQARMHG